MATATKSAPRRKLRGKSPKDVKPRRAKVLIFGEGGVGKTWASLDFPDCYFVDTEGGATQPQYTKKLQEVGAMYLGPDEGAGEFGTVLDEVKTLATTTHDRKTIVIDSISKLHLASIAAEEEAMVVAGRDMSKTFGAEKKPAVKATRHLIRWMDKTDMNFILIAHSKANWVGGEVAGHTFDAYDKLRYELDLCLRIVKTGDSRRAIVDKSRLEGFKDGDSFDWTYGDFAKRFGRAALEGDSVALTLASSEQVSELHVLLENVQTEDGWASKCLDKAGCQSWIEMDETTIQKCIDHLRGKIGGAK